MTWLLNKIQRVLGALTGKSRHSDLNASTHLGGEIASRLQQGSGINEDDALIAVRDHSVDYHSADRGSSVGRNALNAGVSVDLSSAQPTQSTAPLRQKNSSVLKDTIDPIAKQADTHRRLDAAPAAKPGGAPAIPSFPTDVSDLISASPSLPAASSLKEVSEYTSSADSPISPSDVSIPNVDSSAEQLPEIHDLLPAIEPDNSNEQTAPIIGHPVENPQADLDSAAVRADAFSDESIAQSNQVDSALTPSVMDEVPPASRGAVDIPLVDAPMVEPAQRDLDRLADDSSSDDLISDDLVSDDSTSGNLNFEEATAEADDEQATLFSFDIVENESDSPTEENPWLAARQSIATREPESLLTKSGTVKLLFKLKPGNFHGYIAPEDGSKDILFHQKYINAEIFDDLERGARVVATAKQMEGKVYATHVDLL